MSRRWLLFLALALLLHALPIQAQMTKNPYCPEPPTPNDLEVQVATEVRIVTVPEIFFERIGLDFPNPKAGMTPFPEAQLAQFIEALQGDRRGCILAAPKVTTLNGQEATFQITGAPMTLSSGEPLAAGVHLSLRPTVSADRRSVHFKMDADLRSPTPPVRLKVNKEFRIGDGKTMLIYAGTRTVEVHRELPLPKLPYVSRLFKNIGISRETEHILLLVTPRILIGEEEELLGSRPIAVLPAPKAHAEEQETGPSAEVEEAAKLVKLYHHACAVGLVDEAKRLAQKALRLDPTCFDKPTR